MDDHTHVRLSALVGAAVLTAVALAGCSSDGSDPSASGTSGDPSSSAGSSVAPGSTLSASPDSSGSPGSPGSGDSTDSASGSEGPSGSGSDDPGQQDPTALPPLASDEPTPAANGSQADVLDSLEGTSTPGRCVAVAKFRDVRSGSLGGGPFDTMRQDFKPGGTARLYLIPEHTDSLTSATVTARNTATGETFTASKKGVSNADEFKFFDLALTFPSAGTWELKGSTGADSGCWKVTLG